MNLHRIELMGPEYVLMLGVSWGAAMVLTFLYTVAKRAMANRRQRLVASRDARAAIVRHLDA